MEGGGGGGGGGGCKRIYESPQARPSPGTRIRIYLNPQYFCSSFYQEKMSLECYEILCNFTRGRYGAPSFLTHSKFF